MSHSEICPICNGKGLVPNGFYNTTNGSYTSTSTAPETCKSCCGSGYIVIQDSNDFINIGLITTPPKTK